MMPSSPALPQRNAGIDILRGLSIVIVVCHHLSLRIPLAHTVIGHILPHPLVAMFAWGGGDAVTMFFVISGFLITRRTFTKYGDFRTIDAAGFLLHRAARILPLLCALMLVLGVLSLTGLKDFSFRPAQSWSAAVFAVLTCHFNWYEAQTGWPPPGWDVLWSLSIEEAFYLAFPILCLIGAGSRLFLLAALVILGPIDHGLLHESSEIWQEKAYLPGFGAIATGVLAAWLTQRLKQPDLRIATCLIGMGVASACVELLDTGPVFRHVGESESLFLTLGTAMMLLGFHWREASRATSAPARGTGWIRHCGQHSYEIYLTHMFIVMPAVHLWRLTGLPTTVGIVMYPPVLMICACLGAQVARYASRPWAARLDALAPQPTRWRQKPNM
jgi:peptidoglycan/LPS O-acetylase OafA/YrhL